VTAREVRRAPAADLVTDVHSRRDEQGEDDKDKHRELAVESVTKAVPSSRPAVPNVPERRKQFIHRRLAAVSGPAGRRY